jgi:hypothetical protein
MTRGDAVPQEHEPGQGQGSPNWLPTPKSGRWYINVRAYGPVLSETHGVVGLLGSPYCDPQLLMVELDLPAALLMEEKFAPISERAKREPL